MTESFDRSADAVRTGDRTSLTMDERTGSLFQPDSLLVAQYFESLRRKTLFEPEKRLMLAILEDAINCFQDNLLAQDVRNSRLFHEAEEWIVEADSDGVFSFESICKVLGFSPRYVRQGLLRWKEKRLIRRRNSEVWEKIMKEPQRRTA